MALGGVYMTDSDGNIGMDVPNLSEKVCGLLFDISGYPNFWTGQTQQGSHADEWRDRVVELYNLEEAENMGVVPFRIDSGTDLSHQIGFNFLFGVPHYHIKKFFDIAGGTGRLYVMFADCSTGWDALIDMQKAASGNISQFGIWTDQKLWDNSGQYATASSYGLRLVGGINDAAKRMASEYNAPAHVFLCANSASVTAAAGSTPTSETVTWSKIPSCYDKAEARYVTVLLGQFVGDGVSDMQIRLNSFAPVGTVGMALGCCVTAKVSESIGWVQNFDLSGYSSDYPNINFGFGNISAGGFYDTSNFTLYDSLSRQQLDGLEEKGYVFLVKYAGLEGRVYFSGDSSCSSGDYRTVSRNRTINKARRLVRTALLPYVNSPIKVDPSTGQLSASDITVFRNIVSGILTAMQNAGEISGIGSVDIPAAQNVLQNDTLQIKFSIVPIGTAKAIEVSEGFVLKQ